MNSQRMMSFTVACAVAASGFILASPASAQRNERFTVTGPRAADVPIERVRYRDLDLASARDEKRLMRRVGFAIRQVCPINAYLGEPRCRSQAWDGAKPQIALAVERARQVAANGFSSIAPVAIVISVPQ